MAAPPPVPPRLPAFITPLPGDDLLDPGSVFSRDELIRRILSLFWRDCCCPLCFSRAPAPVIELDPEADSSDGMPRRIRAWWLFGDGMIEDSAGPYSERLRPFFADTQRGPQLWPRYEFQIFPEPFEVRMGFHRERLAGQEHRTRLSPEAGGRVRVLEQAPFCRM